MGYDSADSVYEKNVLLRQGYRSLNVNRCTTFDEISIRMHESRFRKTVASESFPIEGRVCTVLVKVAEGFVHE